MGKQNIENFGENMSVAIELCWREHFMNDANNSAHEN